MATIQRGNKGGYRVLLESSYDRQAAELLRLPKRRKGWQPNRQDAERLLKEIRRVSQNLANGK